MQYLTFKYMFILLYFLSIFALNAKTFDSRRSKYKKFLLEDNKVCSVITNRKIKLETEREEGLIISQGKTEDHNADWTTNWVCKFTVEAEHGLFAVVQSLNFRKNDTTGECIDYVRFVTKQTSYNVKLCGKFNVFDASDLNFYNSVDSYGHIDTTIFISREKWRLADKMDLKIAYTQYKRCNEDNKDYSPCKNNSKQQCINNQFVNDSIANCPIDCFDELNCETLKDRLCQNDCNSLVDSSSANSTKIILSAVTSLVVSFLVFIICIWTCRKTGKLCFQANTSESSTPRQPSRTIEMQSRSQETETTAGTQPEVVQEPEKDLPPSYDSLFPER